MFILIGNKNVGKSSIFNKIVGKNVNIVNSTSGSTVDWIDKTIIKDNKKINLIDTPGINPLSKLNKDKKIILLIKSLIKKNSTVLFVVDAKDQLSKIDDSIIKWLRSFNIKIILIINKTDNNKLKSNSLDLMRFGIDNVFYISCSHNIGFNYLNEYIFNSKANFDKNLYDTSGDIINIGVYGKPNAGKSTFLNTLIGFNRFQTGSKPGLTTDSISSTIKYMGHKIRIFDTAGIKLKSKIRTTIEEQSSELSKNNIKDTSVAIMLIDCEKGISTQDKKIINMIFSRGRFIIIVFNKYDLIKDKKKSKKELINQLGYSIYQLKNLTSFFICSFNKSEIQNIFTYIIKNIQFNKKISTNKINLWLNKSTNEYKHPLVKGKRINFKYALQIKSSPITIKIFSNITNGISENYKRFLVNSFIKFFKINDESIKIIYSKSENPYLKK